MNRDALKLTTYFGERDRARGRFLADGLLDLYEQHGFQAGVLLRGVEGFGIKHHLHSHRLLTLSEDLPVVSVAVDTRERIQGALDEVRGLMGDGLVTLERAWMLTGGLGRMSLPDDLHEATKLTVYVGRRERSGGRPAHLAIVDALHRFGIAGATVLVAVDGTAHGIRRRARFFAANADVPLMVISVGAGERIAAALAELAPLLERPLVTLERVRVCKRDGQRLAGPEHVPQEDPSGLPLWQKLMVYAGEEARHARRPLYVEIVHRLRSAGAAGATAIRGTWGYHGDHAPHGDRFWSLTRQVPVVTIVVDTPARVRDWFGVIDELTAETGLVTSELVSAARATGPDVARGGLALAEP